jgi:hypothetical protein
MRAASALIPIAALLLSGCGKHTLALPDDIVGKAATCGVVAAADARAADPKNIAAALPFDRQAQIIHYALLAGAQESEFSTDTASAVVKKMQDIQEDVTEGKWKALVQPCATAFPEADIARPVSLPASAGEAQIGCYTLGKFMMRALAVQGSAYENQLLAYGQLGRDLDPKVARSFDQRGIRSDQARQRARNKELSKFAKLGSPAKVLDACTAQFSKT